jgi:hypothetical protein
VFCRRALPGDRNRPRWAGNALSREWIVIPDGVITRQEWQGNDRSFRNHDWNGDGRLSGDEVPPGAQRNSRWDYRDPQGSTRLRGRLDRGAFPGARPQQ